MAIHHYSARGPSGIERYYKVKELAELTGISRESIYAAIRSGELHKHAQVLAHLRVGGAALARRVHRVTVTNHY